MIEWFEIDIRSLLYDYLQLLPYFMKLKLAFHFWQKSTNTGGLLFWQLLLRYLHFTFVLTLNSACNVVLSASAIEPSRFTWYVNNSIFLSSAVVHYENVSFAKGIHFACLYDIDYRITQHKAKNKYITNK